MRNTISRVSLLFLLVCGSVRAETSATTGAGDDYTREVESWRTERVTRLTSEEGWLSLIGLHFIDGKGPHSLGSADDNDIVLAAGPEHIGAVSLDKYGRVKIQINPGLGVMVDGRDYLSANLDEGDHGKPTMVTCGTMSLYVVDRGGKKALRVKDSESERRRDFVGLDYFPIDPSWRIEAKWVPFDKPKQVPIKDILGQESPAMILGKVVFERDGRTFELLPLQDDLGAPLFLIIADKTSGKETYEAVRFIYADAPRDGKVIIDFNHAINPPCAFTPFATCPLPPAENVLPIAVTAGEKNYRGSHE